MGAMDLSGVYDASYKGGLQYAKAPGKLVRSMIIQLIYLPIIGAVIGYAVATVMGPYWFSSPTGVALGFAGAFFWFASFIGLFQLTGFFIGTRRLHLGAVLLWFVLLFVFAYGIVSFVSDRMRL
jgi:hypothetical protein